MQLQSNVYPVILIKCNITFFLQLKVNEFSSSNMKFNLLTIDSAQWRRYKNIF